MLEAVQNNDEKREQRCVDENNYRGDDQAGGIGMDSGLANRFPGQVEDDDIENPWGDGKQRRGDLSGPEDECEKGRVAEES